MKVVVSQHEASVSCKATETSQLSREDAQQTVETPQQRLIEIPVIMFIIETSTVSVFLSDTAAPSEDSLSSLRVTSVHRQSAVSHYSRSDI